MGNHVLLPRLGRAAHRLILAAILGLGLVACAATYDNHGYVPPEGDLAEISLGDTRDEVAERVGRPATAGVMRDEAWFYTAYRIRNFTYRAPEVVEREIVAISFDQGGRVQNIERFGLEDGQVVQLSRRVTESTVQNLGFFQQLLSNFGRINLGEVL
ncbi:Outer membrane lipoprotein OmlA [Roseibacterium elongatum DSM 19469]|uniref:Outer membrane lipoprotein OmlA n=1 Tax=Roseicyclus elongatus DSM 19469 TaxID=1294273 RepID=W8SQQ9_9RHOB|nr:outer membrane protein assembly factor BamE [Roseibacterium elongatum]AHM04875.1 Outer membrane lipoprotein OmlA [Roseibacterium elongatum DSM 19469]